MIDAMKPAQFAAIAALAAATAVGIHFWRQANRPPSPEPPPAMQQPALPPDQPTLALPPIDQSDSFIREHAQRLSPDLAKILTPDNLLRRLTAAIDIIANGDSPRESLSFLRPRGRFRVMSKKGKLVIDPRSFARYDAVANIIASLDAQAVAKLRRDLAPLLDSAYAELGHGAFEPRLAASIKHLLAVPAPTADLRVRKKVISYTFADPKLEALSPAQKHLLRMGPANMAKVQAKLREIAAALGIDLA